ncbi:MAG: LLM class flavin-dependent oxidoreductase [Rhodospirillales bacterium]|jgi:alkanesulfonate monooxygenase SsuD/methylene tetrahydromethanopterin reductase-like flavin-dependent oxidoreductase (luciferase family)
MRFSQTHHMPYTDITEPGLGWPISNSRFEPTRAIEMFRTYIHAKVYAEECGFDAIGCNEHHMSPFGMMPNPNLIAASVLEQTKTAEIQLSGNILPLSNPIRIAEEYAMIDVMSGGRLMAGFMRGIPHEYVAYNIPPDESWSRMREGVQLILKAWTEPEPFGWDGEHYQFRAVSIWPKPVQKPYPPLLMSGGSPTSARFAAEHKAIMGILRVLNFDQALKLMDVYKEKAREDGWEPGPDRFMVGVPTAVAKTFEEAKRQLEDGTQYFFDVLQGGINRAQQLVVSQTRFHADDTLIRPVNKDQTMKSTPVEERIENGQVLCGTPEMVIDQINRMHAALNHGHMNLIVKVGNMSDDFVLRSMKLLGQHVFPEVKKLGKTEKVAAE